MTGAAGIAGMVPSGRGLATPDDRAFDVIVVGAGMTGLTAARELLGQGYRVLVLEASDRHGGRIHSITLGETRIDMGAEEHYLGRNNPIFDAVTEAFGRDVYTRAYVGDQLISMDGGRLCWEEGGDCEDDPDIRDFWNYSSYYGNPGRYKDFSLTMADDVLARYGVDVGHRAYHLYDSGIAGAIFGASLQRIGAASLAQQDWIWTLSEEIRVLAPRDLGYLDVLDRIWWRNILDHVALNRAVTHIDWSGDHVMVEDSTGSRFTAHKVVVTASIGVLQDEAIGFSPSLPEATVTAYRNIGMGRGMKVALRFAGQFWDSKMAYLVTEGLASTCWVPSAYKHDSEDHILMCYPMGDNGQTLTDRARAAGGGAAGDAVVIRVMLDDLDAIFAGAASQRFVEGRVQDWTAEPWVRGSYSYPMPSTYWENGSMRRQLAQPIGERILFAGEGTSHQNPSCVPGALQQGARAARIIHGMLGGESRPPATA